MKEDFKKLSEAILERIKSSEKILLSLHRSPDGDSIGSNSAFFEILKQLNKNPILISPDPIPENLKFVPHSHGVVVQDIFDFGFNKFDLLLLLDSSSLEMTTNKTVFQELPPKERIIVIDHHATNKQMGEINLVIPDISSTCEAVFDLAQEWKVEFTKNLSLALLAGMATDTGIFQYPNTSSGTLKKAAFLMERGASLDTIVFNVNRRNTIPRLKLLGRILENLQIDKEHTFVYSTLSFSEIEELHAQDTAGLREWVANFSVQSVEGTEFGFILTEEERGVTRLSFRSRRGFDVSRIAVELGGGGHKAAAGCRIQKPLEEALREALKVVKKYAKEK